VSPVSQAVLLLVDGIRPDQLGALVERGEMPAVARLFPGPDGPMRGLASSVFPSTTGPAHLPFLVGRYPGPCNVPGIRWFDPAQYANSRFSPFGCRSYMGPGALLLGCDLAPDVRTLFDLVPDSASAGGNVRRGLRPSRNLTRWSKLREPVLSFFTERWNRLDERVGAVVAAAVARGTTFVFAVCSAADSLGHKFGPFAEPTLEAYRSIDRALAPLADTVCRVPDDRKPLVLLVSDHGMTDTREHLDLHGLVERVAGPCLAHPMVWHARLRTPRAAVMVSGNAMAHVYLRGDDWRAPSYLDQPSAATRRLLDAVLGEPAADQVFGRCSAGGAVVRTRGGEARVERVTDGIRYEVTRGADPFGYASSIAGVHSEREWLELTWESAYPDAPVQVLQVLQSARAGHLVVTAKPGYDLRARFEKPPHVGSHGSLHRDHVMTPLVSNRPLAGGPRRTVDVCPTILDALGVTPPPALDGRSLWGAEGR
jgi:hypothetical protein